MSSSDARETAVLKHPDGEYEMSIAGATEGSPAVELGKLLTSTGLVTLDNGYGNTGLCVPDHLHRR
jgi:citrate synthase